MAEEISLSLLNAKIEKLEAALSACDDALMCLMEVVSARDPEARPIILAKLEDAMKTAEGNENPDLADEIEIILESFRST